MSGVATLPSPTRPRVEHRSLAESMEKVREDLEKVRCAPNLDTVHDLRVAIRRCRSVAAVFEEVDLDPAWPEMRNIAKKLFRTLGTMRDAQIMDEWAEKLLPANDSTRGQLHEQFTTEEPPLRDEVLRVAGKFDDKRWKRLERRLRQRARFIPIGGLAAECLAWERFEEIKELHAAALRSSKPKPWHALRIGLKRLRYTVESLLPLHHSAWNENLKRLQDLLGDIHDLDVLKEKVKTQTGITAAARKSLREIVERERHKRTQTYRHLTLGKTSIWSKWKHGLPHGERLEAASLARLQVTARASQSRPTRSARTSRIALRLFDLLRRAKAGRVFGDAPLRRVLRAAGLLHAIGSTGREQKAKRPHKATRKILLEMHPAPRWSTEDWELMAWTVRFHRGPEPNTDGDTAFSQLNPTQQENIRALAGVLRLARVLHKSGIEAPTGFKIENSADAMVLLVPGLANTLESAAKLAAGKHLLEMALGKPLFLRATATPKPAEVIALPTPAQETLQAVAVGSD